MQSLAVDPNNLDVVFAAFGCPAGTAVVYKSSDGGTSWSMHYTALKDEVPSVMLVDDLLAGMNTGAYEFLETDALSSPVFALWNGYLSMTNILELVNKGASPLSVQLTMYDINGVSKSTQTIEVPAEGERDIILNELTGFSADSYGIVEISYSGANLEGRLFYYRSFDAFESFEFAFDIPFYNPLSGNSYVSFNTYQPSTNLAEAADPVYNWLSIVNLDRNNKKSFTINRYSLGGVLQSSDELEVPAFGRSDIDGGHAQGANNVGYHEIIPADSATQYIAQLVRYGANSGGGYNFAFPLLAKAGGSTEQWVGISSGGGAQNWLEVQNVSSDLLDVALTFYDNTGSPVGTSTFPLPGRSGTHIEASALLSPGFSGAVRIVSSVSSSLIAQSMFYFRNTAGSIEAMYGKQASATLTGTSWGSWNLFLGMYNWLRIFNTESTIQDVTVRVYNGSTLATENVFSLAGRSGIDLGLHETANYGTEVDNYGLLSVQGTGLLTELLRLKPLASGGNDFVATTPVRP